MSVEAAAALRSKDVVGIAPLKPAEFVILTITHSA